MTRSWVFTLPVANQWYNLWDDLIAKEVGFDPTFSNSNYIPSMVSEFQPQSPSPANAGMTLIVAYDSNKEGGTNILAGSADLRRSSRNDINLKTINVKSDTAGATLNVAISAK